MIKHVSEEKFSEVVKGKKVLVDFYATWCGPCKMLALVMEKFDQKNIIDIVKVDIDEAQNLSNMYRISSVPTLVIFENGKEVKRISGFMTENELEDWVNN